MKAAICCLVVTLSITCVAEGQSPLSGPPLGGTPLGIKFPTREKFQDELKELKQITGLRKWTDATGSFSSEARFKGIDFVTASVVFKLKNGDTKTVPLDRLGEEERRVIARYYELETIVNQKLIADLEAAVRMVLSERQNLEETMKGREHLMKGREHLHSDQVSKLKKEIVRLSKFVPIPMDHQRQNNAGGIPTLTITKLQALGQDYVRQSVRFEKIGFIGVDSDYLRRHWPIQMADEYIGMTVCDVTDDRQTGDVHFYVAAKKKEWADLILSLKPGDRINLQADVRRERGRFWLFVEDIQIFEK